MCVCGGGGGVKKWSLGAEMTIMWVVSFEQELQGTAVEDPGSQPGKEGGLRMIPQKGQGIDPLLSRGIGPGVLGHLQLSDE